MLFFRITPITNYGSGSGLSVHNGAGLGDADPYVLVSSKVSRALPKVAQPMVSRLKEEMIEMIEKMIAFIVNADRLRIRDVTCCDMVVYRPPAS